MTPITISKCSNGGYFVSQGDKVADRLGPDEALGVVAHALFGDGSEHRFLDTVEGWQEREFKHRERVQKAIEPVATPPPSKGNVVGYEFHALIPVSALNAGMPASAIPGSVAFNGWIEWNGARVRCQQGL